MTNNTQTLPLSDTEWDKLRTDSTMRLALARESFTWFFHLYLHEYITYATAPFQLEMMNKASDPNIEHLVVMAFRGSGKSSILTTGFPIWTIAGKLQKKYVVIVSQTQALANQHLKSIALELENNKLMKQDIWPYYTDQNESGSSVINLPKFNAKIIAMGREQAMRGLRHGPHRPDLIIADDVEDINTTRYMDARNANFAWFTGELIPLGGPNTKYITVGNLLHDDSLLMRLKRDIETGEREGVFLEYPLVDEKGIALWQSRYPTTESIRKLEKRIANRITWLREYMLILVPNEDQIITKDMVHTYPEIPVLARDEREEIIIGVDLAIAEHNRADYTAMVKISVRGKGDKLRMYVHPYSINKRMGITETMEQIKTLDRFHHHPKFFVEQVGYQQALVRMVEQEGINVSGYTPHGSKRERLNMIAYKIQTGVILFPEGGHDDLIKQLVGFEIEKHDDLVDALTSAVIERSTVVPTRNTAVWAGRRRPSRRNSYPY